LFQPLNFRMLSFEHDGRRWRIGLRFIPLPFMVWRERMNKYPVSDYNLVYLK
jgi:hypothetical protein